MITSYEYWTGPWHDVEWLIAETEKLYAEHVTPKGLGDRFSVAALKILEARRWKPSHMLIEENLEPVLRELGIFYIPKIMDPGPCVVFPILNLQNRPTHARFWPMYELVLKSGPAKYAPLGKIATFQGPMWLGNSDRVLMQIMRTRKVILVEGPFDMLACRVLFPDTPVLTALTKSFNEDHVDYLRMLGVKNAYLMFDNEPAKDERALGAGNQAMEFHSRKWNQAQSDITFQPLLCPSDDAALCLEGYASAIALRNVLKQVLTR